MLITLFEHKCNLIIVFKPVAIAAAATKPNYPDKLGLTAYDPGAQQFRFNQYF